MRGECVDIFLLQAVWARGRWCGGRRCRHNRRGRYGACGHFAAKRARQINSYFTQLNEGLLQNVGPLVEYQNQEKPLSIAFREIDEGLLEETLGEDDLSEGN